MKKKLEADLISIAHRVLQIKNKSDINQLYIEAQKLYEKLSVLKFVEEHFGEVKPTIGQTEVVEKMKQFFEENDLNDFTSKKLQDKIVVEEIIEEKAIVGEIEEVIEEEVEEKELEEISSDSSIDSNLTPFHPAFELDVEIEEETLKKPEAIQISFEDLLGGNYDDTLFVKADTIKTIPKSIDLQSNFEKSNESDSVAFNQKTVSLNEKLSQSIKIDLNDKIAFVKHLFGNSDEDFNRVLNQLITYDSFEEAQNFIEDMVKPDYNDWEGKEDYSQRFMEVIEKKFA